MFFKICILKAFQNNLSTFDIFENEEFSFVYSDCFKTEAVKVQIKYFASADTLL